MVFNYSSEWASAILHVKTNGKECTSFSSFCSVPPSNSGCEFPADTFHWQKLVEDKICCNKKPLESEFPSKLPSKLSIFDRNS